ncbi:MAG: cupin [Oceanicaulis sp.]|uniref:cupin domain-containing protein n=1 Tax=unclassified Oceanicaulis TaxID=2632123 RepID=UPI000C5E71AB|nr:MULTISPECIES: cupin domain-containing protein [unclassified Oceanicaulis]MAB69504.1 cupin [Oceanicaulis sp.]MBC38487.1 cupin [Oceanicaulis sp.]MBG35425.1 cupin [Oceanicaulis sp.]HBU62970.1 cupin domain-containing protein [Oceanicaulis sp.]|tara:strand:+ start:3687 stop:4076 length:390 start_codon:yes stop_codon:yes gene_type:complete
MFADVKRLEAEFAQIHEHWSPRVIARVNDQYVKLAKLKGEFVWHDHAQEDELFFIVKGRLEMQYEDRTVALSEGDMHVVPKGVQHNPVAQEECWVMLVEPVETKHTGDVMADRTRSLDEQLAGSGLEGA